jgi:MoCo/4Fe-4S cofactor protein with predicted Tat translocation signal
MKRTPTQSETNAGETTGPHYWRSLNELTDKPAFKEWLHREFPEGASEADGVNRRSFLKIMAASFAMAGMGAAGCRRPEQYILPYSKQPEGNDSRCSRLLHNLLSGRQGQPPARGRNPPAPPDPCRGQPRLSPLRRLA